MRRTPIFVLVALLLFATKYPEAQSEQGVRAVTGTVFSDRGEVVSGATVSAEYASGKIEAVTDGNGAFRLQAPREPLKLKVSGKYVVSQARVLSTSDASEDLELKVTYRIAPVHESLVITATALNPTIDERNDNVYKSTLFSRDDQG